MNQSQRNLMAGAIVLQLAILDAWIVIKADAGGAVWWKLSLYVLFFVALQLPARS